MNPLPEFPVSVHRHIRNIFATANRRVAEKIARVPNCPEPSLDHTLIDSISFNAGPRVVEPGWTVQVDIHSLGGMRHFHDWEIADIGVLVCARNNGNVVSQKVSLLQSKRLYPKNHGIREETEEDYRIGFGRLLPASAQNRELNIPHLFEFTEESKYREIRNGEGQVDRIRQYEEQSQIPVHYLFYNPWKIDCSYQYPIDRVTSLGSTANGGARVISATSLREKMADKDNGYQPTLADIAWAESSADKNKYGWRLEHFISDRLLRCKEGRLFENLEDDGIFALFNRRSGPIAAAISINIEQSLPR